MKNEFNCVECGACCWSIQEQASFCDLTEAECDRFTPQFLSKNVEFFSIFDRFVSCQKLPAAALRTKWLLNKSGPFKGVETLVCCQLDGSILQKVRCKIYEKRPGTCKRSVKPGDRTCRQIRNLLWNSLEDL
jgi:Fe-S-cluster containining protein